MKYAYLSYPMSRTAPRPPAIPEPEISDFQTIAKDGASVQKVTFYNHTGTHLDTAAHVFEDGISIEEFSPDELRFEKISFIPFDLPDKYHVTPDELKPFADSLQDCDMIIARFGVENIRANDGYRFSNLLPGITREAAQWLRSNCPKLRCFGTDLPSFAVISDLENTMTSHNVFLNGNENKMLIIEEMKLTEPEPLEGVERITVVPWFVEGVNSGPCTVIAEYTEEK